MSGHSKWNNIKRKKEKTDGAKAKIFTKMAREIVVAVKEGGGGDPSSNSRLRDAIAKAKAANVPNDNIERAIKRAAEAKGEDYETILYEGYGPNGVAMIVETMTDNRNRTAANMRHYFDKFGGNLGTSGCVSFLFNQKGVLVLEAEGLDEEKVMEDCFEAGAEDFDMGEEYIEITTAPADLSAVREAMEGMGYKFESFEVAYLPTTETAVEGEDNMKNMTRLLDSLDEDDDVQEVWHNLANEDALDR
ncbi:MAG: YebC/PmpR family DNA-binding transcriptional regulator [Oscillospiraceae bacterium]|nr:YebC/PmpR family DNA-binding transcriptional regulator [Oscillospiraceae bacterium]